MRTAFIGLLCIFTSYAVASVNVSGTFLVTAEQCPAYVSKNNKTNPDHLSVYRDQNYPLKEINRPSSPDWFRVQVEGNDNPLRWVSASCGQANYDVEHSRCDKAPGMANTYLLALSWQPGFCETYGYEAGKPECQQIKPESYPATHFTLHGLWPDQDACGINYGFCGASKQSIHCNYPPVNLSAEVGDHLAQLMPSYAVGSCLERHEWNKHGSCQFLTADDYFSQAMDLVDQINVSSFRQFIQKHIGSSVKQSDVFKQFEQSFGQGSAKTMHLGCTNNTLVDIYITVPVLNQTHNDLKTLLAQSEGHNVKSQGCGTSFTISDFSGS